VTISSEFQASALILSAKTEMRTTMRTATSAERSATLTTISPHATGHAWASDGTLLRVDREGGTTWVATRYDVNLRVVAEVRGSDSQVHRIAARWTRLRP
jgi:hypothetical protein